MAAKEKQMKQSVFDVAWNHLMATEGGGVYANNPKDPGGATRWGITLDTLRHYRNNYQLSGTDVLNLTENEAKEICFAGYFEPLGLLEVKDAALAIILLDQGFNRGVDRIRHQLSELAELSGHGIISNAEIIKLMQWNKDLQTQFLVRSVEVYVNLCKNQDRLIFLRGWINRVLRLFDLVK